MALGPKPRMFPMPDAPLPPCGPERDRLAALAVGWTDVWQQRYHRHTECVNHGVRPGKPGREAVPHYSTINADALALLEAWVEAGEPGSRKYRIERWVDGHFSVYLWPVGFEWAACHGPTLRDALTAAVIDAERGSA